jgi:orotate phosphoribosyltransferase
MYDQQMLIELIRERALEFGQFRLASGKIGTYYLDCRRVTLDSRGARLISDGMLDLLGDDWPDSVGGMAIGADPITGALITTAAHRGRQLKGFIVRKEAKTHGKGRDVEGPVQSGESCIIVEDVVTTGGSSLAAIEKVEAFGMTVRGVLAVVDRLEGGSEAFRQRGYQLRSLLTIRDFGIEA